MLTAVETECWPRRFIAPLPLFLYMMEKFQNTKSLFFSFSLDRSIILYAIDESYIMVEERGEGSVNISQLLFTHKMKSKLNMATNA